MQWGTLFAVNPGRCHWLLPNGSILLKHPIVIQHLSSGGSVRLSRFLISLSWLVGLASLTSAAERKPNFVILLADDLGYGDLGVQGHPKIKTPSIDRMAAEGVRLTEFYSAAPTCTPARAALLTGRYPARSGLVRVLLPKEKWGIPASEITLAEALKQEGYATALIGKWHLGGRKPFRPNKHGFDYFFGLLFSNDMTVLPVLRWPRLELWRNDKPIESPAKVKTLTRRYTEEAVSCIEQHRDKPFFLYVSYTMPHAPLRPSDEFRGKSDFGDYGDVVEEIDWSTGRILQALNDTGLDDETLVIFTSDNGPWKAGENQERQTRGSAGRLRGVKGTTWEGGMRVPFVARWPGRLPAGSVRSGISVMTDLFTTLIELAGGEVPSDRDIDGKNIMPMLEGRARSPHSEVYYYFRKRMFAVRSGEWKLHLFKRVVGPGGRPSDPVRPKKPELYNLVNDPEESRDLAGRHPEIVERLSELGQSFQATVKPALRLPGRWRSISSGLTTQAPKSEKRARQ